MTVPGLWYSGTIIYSYAHDCCCSRNSRLCTCQVLKLYAQNLRVWRALKTEGLPYSGKIWQALNLAISAKTPYYLIWRVLNFVDSGPRPPNVMSPLRSRLWKSQASWLIESWMLPISCWDREKALAGPFSSAHLPILALSRVYLLYFENS